MKYRNLWKRGSFRKRACLTEIPRIMEKWQKGKHGKGIVKQFATEMCPPPRTLHRLEGVPFRKGGAHVIIAPLKSVFLSRHFCLIVPQSKRETFLLNEDFFFFVSWISADCLSNGNTGVASYTCKWGGGRRLLFFLWGIYCVNPFFFLPQIFAVWVLSTSQCFTEKKRKKKKRSNDNFISLQFVLLPATLALQNIYRAKVW